MCNNHNIREFDHTIKLANNAMLKIRPELFYEWDFEKNDELGLDVYKVTKGSYKIAWWICPKCRSDYDMLIYNRLVGKQNCPYCSGKRVNHTNSLASLNSELASEWHPTKNGNLTPHDITSSSGIKVWWKCNKGHEWEANVDNRNSKGFRCPYCAGVRILKGFNDMWATNPELAKLLANPDDGYKYMQSSNKKVDWKCHDCGEIIKNKSIAQIHKQGISCPNCSDGKSYPEKVVYHLLTQLGVYFEWEMTFDWAKNKRYDFFLQSYNMIIEVNGEQHYGKGFKTFGGRSLKEEQENDKQKKTLARENGIDKYITIDARYSDIDYIKNSIIHSKLNRYFNLDKVDWGKINEESLSSLFIKTIELWNKGYTITDISNKLKITRVTVYRHLIKGKSIGLCNYNKELFAINKYKKYIQLSLNNSYVKEWVSLKEASDKLNIHKANISACCRGKRKTAGGYKWMYKEDYDKLIHNQEVV